MSLKLFYMTVNKTAMQNVRSVKKVCVMKHMWAILLMSQKMWAYMGHSLREINKL
jgi:hypothetical protein